MLLNKNTIVSIVVSCLIFLIALALIFNGHSCLVVLALTVAWVACLLYLYRSQGSLAKLDTDLSYLLGIIMTINCTAIGLISQGCLSWASFIFAAIILATYVYVYKTYRVVH